jgi:plasmid stability protein
MHIEGMRILQIRELPDDIYRQLRERAGQDRRSLTQEAVIAIEQGLGAAGELDSRRERRRRVIAAAQEEPIGLPARAPLPAVLIRKDRER